MRGRTHSTCPSAGRHDEGLHTKDPAIRNFTLGHRDSARVQVDKIVGKGAPTEFIEQLEDLVNTHHERVEVDVIRAYHFGARFIVEVRP